MRPDTMFYPQLLRLASCLCSEIADSGLPEPCFCGLLPGDNVPLDYCSPCDDQCGMAWVRVIGVVQSQNMSTSAFASATPAGCGPLEATVEVGIARCAPGPDSDGNPPSMADQLAASELTMADMAAALRAIKCCFANSNDYLVANWTPFGPAGGCMGGTWSLTIYEGV
jgi:hypothetical protein